MTGGSANGEGTPPRWDNNVLAGLDGGSMVVLTLLVVDLCT